jgi:GNAT superfamily N-acetyltransferase
VPAIPPPVHSDEDVRQWVATVVLPNNEAWVAETDADGVIALLVLDNEWIDQLYVDPEWTGHGVGSQLIELAKELRPRGLDLWTFQSNEGARRFYERHGFIAVGTTEGANEEGAPDVHYHCGPI